MWQFEHDDTIQVSFLFEVPDLREYGRLNTMASPKFVLYLSCLILGNIVGLTDQNFSASHQQETRIMSANVGESLTLPCFYEKRGTTRFYWYKQSLGQKPKLISTQYVYQENGTFHGEFESDPRFTLDTNIGNNHLHIKDLQNSDSATYYCARRISLILEFAEGTTVSVKGSGLNINTLVQQSASEIIQHGGSTTLNCTVHTGTCDGEHSVYWFRSSEGSHPGLIYTQEGRNDQCERKPNAETHNCIYSLPMKSLNQSDAGTYYCAVVSCGHILFGEGTKVDIVAVDEVDSSVLRGALALITIISILLVSSLCVIIRIKTESSAGFSDISTKEEQDYQNVLKDNKNLSSRQQRTDTCSECVYFIVKQES